MSAHTPTRTSEHCPEHFPIVVIDDVPEHTPDLMPEQAAEHCVNPHVRLCRLSLSMHAPLPSSKSPFRVGITQSKVISL